MSNPLTNIIEAPKENAVQLVEVIEMPLRPEPKDIKRLTVVLDAKYEKCCDGDLSVGIHSMFEVPIRSEEQVYVRHYKVSQIWVPLDLGWLKDCAGYLFIENKRVHPKQNLPKEEQEKLDGNLILLRTGCEVYPTSSAHWEISPGGIFIGQKPIGSRMMVKCVYGGANMSLHVIPR